MSLQIGSSHPAACLYQRFVQCVVRPVKTMPPVRQSLIFFLVKKARLSLKVTERLAHMAAT